MKFSFSRLLTPHIKSYHIIKKWIKSNQIKSNQIKARQIKANQIQSNQSKTNQGKARQIKSQQYQHWLGAFGKYIYRWVDIKWEKRQKIGQLLILYVYLSLLFSVWPANHEKWGNIQVTSLGSIHQGRRSVLNKE